MTLRACDMRRSIRWLLDVAARCAAIHARYVTGVRDCLQAAHNLRTHRPGHSAYVKRMIAGASFVQQQHGLHTGKRALKVGDA